MFARGVLTVLDGTLLLGWVLRAFGVQIGRGVVLGRGFAQVVDPDMLAFDDGATVASMFQAHSFEDRVLKIDRVRIGARATVRAGAVLFYGAEVGARATVWPHGVVMKHERLAEDGNYEGCPV
jgi:acetyltransferase-like isoleucine patch superfamily enzyme